MRKKLLAGAFAVILLMLFVQGTSAYFTAESTAKNTITTGSVRIELRTWADEAKKTPFPADVSNGVMPGTEITKIAEVTNTGKNPAYIRVKLVTAIELAKGRTETPDTSLVHIAINTADWTEKDGFYYYNKPLLPGETTTPVYTRIGFDRSMDNVYQQSTATVDTRAYATQVANNGATVFEAKGWPAE